ncbi:N-acetylmuramoyl-L-alanine amidase [Kineococcus rhizosphaerae]|uniref:LGFP repeat-containing protein n=1 Tax=Kineococcus rhizosphaerae TaxID=559628 RepID=A0A2T0R0E1_9ACTN|nr:N-acetylmuramoyl-L-alanine amidase [Kineococcus rhizosphaerae]PRY12570.1 LGFP repeat-containing protein [Kineococcus rhizosphaerae]
MRSVKTPLSRRALISSAVGTGVAGAVLLGSDTSASALTSGDLQVTGSTRAFALGEQRSASLLSTDGLGTGLTTVSVDVDGGHMIGVTFPSGASTDTVSLRVKTATGSWTTWRDVPLNDSEPDPDTAEGRRSVTASDPLWVGALGTGATVQVRLPSADVHDAHLQLVDAGESTTLARRTLDAAQPLATKASPRVLPQPAIKTRAQWGADESLRKGGVSYSDTIKACVVHHTADGGTYSQAEVPSVIRGMYRYHTVSLGWSDLGYNFVVDRFGGIWEGRAGGITQPVIGAHAGGFNLDTFGVSMMGDFTSVAPSAACLESVAQVIAWKLSTYGLPADGVAYLTSAGGGTAKYSPGTTVKLRTINAHRDVGYTACPGNVGFTKMDWIRGRVGQLLGGATTTAIDAKYQAIGGAGNIGGPTTPENDTPNGSGSYRFYSGGAIYWSKATGAHTVRGAILALWGQLGWENGLGYPTTDDSPAKGGFYNHFQGGSIYWSPATGAHEVRGAIRLKWAAMGWEGGPAGFPVTGDRQAAGGWFTHFQGGSIYYSAKTGARWTTGAIRDRWAALGWERGLGFPTIDDTKTPNGKGYFNVFEKGNVYWSPATGAHAVAGDYLDAYGALGWENSWLGFPTRDAYSVDGGTRVDFEGGSLTWSRTTDQITAKKK